MTSLALAVLLAHAAAAQPQALDVKALDAAKGFEQASVERLSTSMTVRECARDAKCWSLVKTMFLKNFDINRTRVDAGMPGQFFPGASTFALRAAVKGTGHYLYVLCGADARRQRPCDDKRDELEKRVFEAALALSLPGASRPEDRADLDTLKLSPTGKQLLSELRGARPGAVEELLDAAISSLGVEENPIPRALRR